MTDKESYKLFSRCGDDSVIVISTLPDNRCYRFKAKDADAMYRKVISLGKTKNTYISVNPRGPDLPERTRGRGFKRESYSRRYKIYPQGRGDGIRTCGSFLPS